ncbi:hypothetical protein ANN_19593 [Periplaneta americana]|uniref:Uncharacterized protein n=1 Tax=Periplaneta americana TaxID=6978 RepID=A0ABQ8SAY5_PERAM|nr:hypothetical protein ANN_19593 [Periplaneta americana]
MSMPICRMDSDSSSQGSSDDSDISSRKKKKKLMFIYPDRLGALALEVLGKHVSQLMITLYTGKKYLTLPDLLKVCRQMEKIVQFPLPPPLLNELTATLMEHACNTWCDLNRSSDLQPRVETWDPELYKQSWNLKNVLKIASSKARKHLQKKRNLGEEYFLEILSAIINPSITLFDCSLQTLFDCPPYNADILERLSKKFNNLKILRLGRRNVDRDSLFESVKHMGNLEEFACQTTWDGLLRHCEEAGEGNVRRIFEPRYSKICARWIPEQLTDVHEIAKPYARNFLNAKAIRATNIFKTCDRRRNIASSFRAGKQESQWNGTEEEKKFKYSHLTGKVMATICWVSEGLLLVDIMTKDAIISCSSYVNTLKKLRSLSH